MDMEIGQSTAHVGSYSRAVDQRLAAAFLAISRRCSLVRVAARAFPPFSPPRRPRLTAAGSLPDSGRDSGESIASPVAISTIRLASWFRSAGRFWPCGPLGMLRMWHPVARIATGAEAINFQTETLPARENQRDCATLTIYARPAPPRRVYRVRRCYRTGPAGYGKHVLTPRAYSVPGGAASLYQGPDRRER
jgi:hypothetical protein